MLVTLSVIEAEHLADRITVVRRDGTVLYDNELVDGAWRRRPAAEKAVAYERSRPWSAPSPAAINPMITPGRSPPAQPDNARFTFGEAQRSQRHSGAKRGVGRFAAHGKRSELRPGPGPSVTSVAQHRGSVQSAPGWRSPSEPVKIASGAGHAARRRDGDLDAR
ncbi:hypothetical protein NLX86_33720 [Streptomyces sp. A3M-1-3]|nr:hypothetical protein [Streptomyces sp. A3M-1-3]MCP3822857.1 hypothetical protein [Streptomyces sp. A3M-1-3]